MHVIHHHPPPSKYRPSTPIEPLRCWWRLGKLNRNPSGQQRGHFKDFVKRGHLCIIDLCKWPFCILGLSGFHWRADVTAWYIYVFFSLGYFYWWCQDMRFQCYKVDTTIRNGRRGLQAVGHSPLYSIRVPAEARWWVRNISRAEGGGTQMQRCKDVDSRLMQTHVFFDAVVSCDYIHVFFAEHLCNSFFVAKKASR
jgi:hypothetical protein